MEKILHLGPSGKRMLEMGEAVRQDAPPEVLRKVVCGMPVDEQWIVSPESDSSVTNVSDSSSRPKGVTLALSYDPSAPDVYVELTLGTMEHSRVQIVAYKTLNVAPDVSMKNAAVMIAGSEVGESTDWVSEQSVEAISMDGRYILAGAETLEIINQLIKAGQCYIYDYCGELHDLGTGTYVRTE